MYNVVTSWNVQKMWQMHPRATQLTSPGIHPVLTLKFKMADGTTIVLIKSICHDFFSYKNLFIGSTDMYSDTGNQLRWQSSHFDQYLLPKVAFYCKWTNNIWLNQMPPYLRPYRSLQISMSIHLPIFVNVNNVNMLIHPSPSPYWNI